MGRKGKTRGWSGKSMEMNYIYHKGWGIALFHIFLSTQQFKFVAVINDYNYFGH